MFSVPVSRQQEKKATRALLSFPALYKRELARGENKERERERAETRSNRFLSSVLILLGGRKGDARAFKERNILLLQKRYLSFRFKDTSNI